MTHGQAELQGCLVHAFCQVFIFNEQCSVT